VVSFKTTVERPVTGLFNSVGSTDTLKTRVSNLQGQSQTICDSVGAGCDTEEGVVGGVVSHDSWW